MRYLLGHKHENLMRFELSIYGQAHEARRCNHRCDWETGKAEAAGNVGETVVAKWGKLGVIIGQKPEHQ